MEEVNVSDDEVYRVKEDLLLKNFLEQSRKNKAKVLRKQQVKNYTERLQSNFDTTLARLQKQSDVIRHVSFSPASLIQDAIKEGNKYEVLDFLNNGVPINFNGSHGEGMSLLHQACLYDDYIIAQALIKKGASVNLQDDYGCTPIHICCIWDSLKCAQLLISNNVSTNILDIDGNFAVDLAPENSHLKAMMKKHMQQKLKIDESQLQSLRNKTQKTMLHDIRHLLEDGSSVDVLSSAGVSLLHIAVTNGYVTAARMLLENSANVNSADLQMWTPLHCAAKYGQAKMVKLLLSHYANPHARTTSGFTPRELAKDPEIATMLLNAEDTFLDLDNQKTPSKPKRFSASLLDQCEEGEDVTRVNSRIISSSKISKRDVTHEKELVAKRGEDLKQELKLEMQFHPPDAHSSSSVSSIPTWHQLMPPPVPPRDDPPEIQSSLSSPKKSFSLPPEVIRTNKVHDETFLNAVITIQRALRRYLKSRQNSPLKFALRTIDIFGSSFYEEMVFQNAEDIARESDRQRSRKSLQRNSWSNDLRRSIRNNATHRPLSTGTLGTQMPHAHENTEIWLPQDPMQSPYRNQVHTEVMSQYPEPKDFTWNTMPVSGQRKNMKGLSTGSTDSGVSLESNHKEYIQLTKTVKESLIIAENPELQPTTHAATLARIPTTTLPRPHVQPTYRMPPLTPTVATLINTAAVPVRKQKKQQRSPPTSLSKGMTQQAAPVYPENPYLVPDGMDNSNRTRNSPARDHKYGSLLSNRGNVLRDARMQNINHQELPGTQNRHSWNGDQEETSTNFGRGSRQHPLVSPCASYESRNFANGIQSSSERNHARTTHTMPAPSSHRRNNKAKSSDAMPPPPPRRAPTTKLSVSSESVPAPPRKTSAASLGPPPPPEDPRANVQRHMSLPLVRHQPNLNLETHDSSPEEDLPDIPPPLPLYTPQALTHQNMNKSSTNRDSLPAPPPPDVLLYDTMKNMGSLQRKQYERFHDLPPPPPTL